MVGKVGKLFRKELNYPLINFTVFMLLLYIGISNIHLYIAFFMSILSILLPFFLGFVVAYAMNPFVVFLEKKRIPRKIAVFIVVFIILTLLGFLILTIFPILYRQIVDFTIQLIQIINHFSKKLQFPSRNLEIIITRFFNQILQNVGNFTTATTFHFFGGFFQIASQFIIGVVSFICFLLYMGKLRFYFKKVLVIRHPKVYQYFLLLDDKMLHYVEGVGLLMLVQFIEYSCLFLLIGHPHWLILGIIIGLFTAVPYVGGLISNLIALLTAFMISKTLFYATLFVCLFFPLVDEYFISPKIYGKSNDIHPVLTIFLLSIGGSLGGILGIILAIPIYLFVRTTITFFWFDVKNGAKNIKDVL